VPEASPAPGDNPTTAGKAELGKKLFFDRRLSGDGTMHCGSCHDPGLGFSDGAAISLHYPTTKNWRNSPTLINVGFMERLFHDGRAASLEEQALFPMMSAFEMNQNLDYVEEEIRAVPEYRDEFFRIFGSDVDRELIAKAIAAFERTLVSRNSPLDRYLKGDRAAMSPEALKGMELFRGRAGCIRCHHGVNLSDQAFHVTGVPENPAIWNDPRTVTTVRFVAKVSGYKDYRELEEDPGRYLVTKRKKDWKAFRTPALRDVSRTAPYMHNGIFATIDEVLEFYNRGGGKGNRELKPLGLTGEEMASLREFLMEALTGDEIRIAYPEIP
jgi:cytochrome c peroxidase